MAVALRCPRDGAEALLKSVQGPKGRFQLDVCPRCGGAWFDKGEITKISGEKEVERMIIKYASGPSGLACPRCGRDMATRPVGDLTLDVCEKCRGVWADSGELEKAARTLGTEFSEVQASEAPELARAVLIAHSALGTASVIRNLILNPPPKRNYPPDVL